jgi:hypothetical protein
MLVIVRGAGLLEFCPYCQRWVEAKKDAWDVTTGTLALGLPGLIAGGLHYLVKGERCPICNNVIRGWGSRSYIPQQAQVSPQPPYQPVAQPPQQYQHPPQRYEYPQQYTAPSPAPPRPAPPPSCPRCGRQLGWMPLHRYWACIYCDTVAARYEWTPVGRPSV